MTALHELGAREAARRIAAGEMGSEEYVGALVERIAAEEPRVQAWAHYDPDYALEQARRRDREADEGLPLGPLHGVPVGLKDIIDTYDFPTENGSVLHAGRTPERDAVVVARLRAAGAVILGKTVTTEFATYAPGKTRNPHHASHTPGGSSSGSAAAVAAGMVPLAVGTQTNGSVIRPAAYCGVVGYKPTYGLIPRTGILMQSAPLDQVGVFARTVEDAALLAETLVGQDDGDSATRPRAHPRWLEHACTPQGAPPRLGWSRTPWWDRVEPDARYAIEGIAARLGAHGCDLPLDCVAAVDWQRTVMEADIAGSFDHEYETGAVRLSDSLRGQIERGRRISAVDYRKAQAHMLPLAKAVGEAMAAYDALIVPATTGTAPAGLDSTGSPLLSTLWTYCGMPAISLPLLRGGNGLPLGVQLIGRRGEDARLLRTALWIMDELESAD